MRLLIAIFIASVFCFSCAKKQTKDPVPVIEYKDFKAWKVNGSDTAILTIGYEDGDGDIFRENNSKGPNFIGTFYYLNSATHVFTTVKDIITNDTARFTQTILQPAETSYKGKAVKGEMFIPWQEFRKGDSIKIFMYKIFMIDDAGNKSNVLTTPVYTINF
ncbi:MAG: hypothetical protein JWO32_56 [Bacteroidetes bacterium]|nr:hypothetical protein [Bacteroidota bacterium]